MADIATNVILANPDNTICCQDQTVSGLVHRKILRGPFVVPTLTGATWTISASRSRWWYLWDTATVYFSPYPTAPTHASIHDYADAGLSLSPTSEYDDSFLNTGFGIYKYVSPSISNNARYDVGWSHSRQIVKTFGELTFNTAAGTGHVKYKRITSAQINLVVSGTVYYTISSSPGAISPGSGTAISGTATIDITSQLEALNRNGTVFYVIFQGAATQTWNDTTGGNYNVFHPAPSSEYFVWQKVLSETTATAYLDHIHSCSVTYNATFDGGVT